VRTSREYLERAGPGSHDGRVQRARGKLIYGARGAATVASDSDDGERGSLAFFAYRDFRESPLAIIENQISYLLEFNFFSKNLKITYTTWISNLLSCSNFLPYCLVSVNLPHERKKRENGGCNIYNIKIFFVTSQ